MKLTNYIREAFLTSAILEVPQVDYKEQIRVDSTKAVLAALPEHVRLAHKNQDTSTYLNSHYRSFGHGSSICVPGFRRNGVDFPVLASDDQKHLAALVAKAKAQEETLVNLRAKLRTAAFACTTRKALAEMLPEFEKYLPEEKDKGGRYLPVVANIVADFKKAGWPNKLKAVKKAPEAVAA